MTDPIEERLVASVRAKECLDRSGVASTGTILLQSAPNAPLVELVKRVPGLTAWDLSRLLRVETKGPDLEQLARRLLIGELRRSLPNGWPEGRDRAGLFQVIQAFISWSGFLGPDLQDRCDAVETLLDSLPPPPGWTPESVDDPVLAKAFAAWTDI